MGFGGCVLEILQEPKIVDFSSKVEMVENGNEIIHHQK